MLLLGVFLARFIPTLDIDASSDSLVLEKDQSLKTYRQVIKRYGSSEFILLTYTPYRFSLFSEGALDEVAAIKSALTNVKGVESVTTYLDVPLLYSPKVDLSDIKGGIKHLPEADAALARQEFLNSPIYKQLITSQDEKTTAIVVNLEDPKRVQLLRLEKQALLDKAHPTRQDKQALKRATKAYDKAVKARKQLEKDLIADVRQIADRYSDHAQIFVGGVPLIVADMLDFLRSDMAVFGIAIIAFIILLLGVIFQRVRWVVIPMLTCVATAVYMLGGIGLVGVKLTVLSANFIAILLIITLSIAVHLIVRFIEEEKKQPNATEYELVVFVMKAMFRPCVFTTLTTLVAFMSLVLSGIKPVIDFGWMMTIAVSVALLVSFLVIPACLLLIRRHYHETTDQVTNRLVDLFARFSQNHAPLMLFVGFVIGCVAVTGSFKLKVENRFIDNFSEDTEIYQGMLTIDRQLGGTLPLSILIRHEPAPADVAYMASAEHQDSDDSFFDDEDFSAEDFASDTETETSYWFTRAGLEDVEKIHAFLEAQPDSGKVLSLATLYHVVQDISGGHVDDIQLAFVKNSLDGEIKDTLITPYLSSDGKETRIAVRVKETSKGLERNEYIKNIKTFLTDELGYKEDDITLTGMMVMYNNLLQSLFSSQIQTLGAVFVAIMLMFAVLFRSVSLAVIGILPNLLAAGLVLGLMGWLSIPLDIMTITIAAITLGIGVDDTIHYLHRFKKEFQKDGDYLATVYRCHHSTGLAMFYTSVTIVFGFSILALSNFTPSIYFGLLTSLAMVSALLGALVLLPSMLIIFKPLRQNCHSREGGNLT